MGPELEKHFEDIKAEKKQRERNDIQNTLCMALIGAGLGYWAWQTLAHAAFSFFLLFAISAAANRVTGELFRMRAQQKATEIMDREGV